MKILRMIKSVALISLLLLVGSLIYAQSELDIELGLYGGIEQNIFKSPDVLLDRITMEPLPQDSLIYSDLFIDFEYDFQYGKTTDRSIFEVGSDLWYRKYFEFTDLNQARLAAFVSYQFNISESLNMKAGYNFLWSNRIGTSETGDLLMRSFKYFGHQGNYSLNFQATDAIMMRLIGEFQYKDYYDERTRAPLDHGNLDIAYKLDYEFNGDHELSLELSLTDRNYYEYRSLDSIGKYDVLNPTREFIYYRGGFGYNWSPVRGMRINPGIDVIRRIDIYQDYYSYFSIGGNLRIRYFNDKFYVSLFSGYKRVEYDVRKAYTSMPDDPMLIYAYLDIKFTFRYSISDQWEAFLKMESDGRNSNTDLEYFKTRRPYQNYQALIGIRYSLPQIKW